LAKTHGGSFGITSRIPFTGQTETSKRGLAG
jgi:hypothetical protein